MTIATLMEIVAMMIISEARNISETLDLAFRTA